MSKEESAKRAKEGAVPVRTHRGVSEGDRVWINAGDEAGSWGIVRLIRGDEFHVAVAGGTDERLYDREEITRPRNQARA